MALPFGAPGAGIRGTMVAEGLLGAASTPENALSGFALGAAGGAVGGAAVAGLRALKPSLARGVATGREMFSNTRGAAVDAAEAARPGRMTPSGWLNDMPG